MRFYVGGLTIYVSWIDGGRNASPRICKSGIVIADDDSFLMERNSLRKVSQVEGLLFV